MLSIIFKDGDVKIYKEKHYTDYRYYKDVFAVIKKSQWVGIYSMDMIKAIEVGKTQK